MAKYLYAVLSPIKHKGKVVRDGTIELDEKIGDELVASGHAAVTTAAKAESKKAESKGAK